MTTIPDRLIEYDPEKSYGTYKSNYVGKPVLVSLIHPDQVKQLIDDMPHIYEFRNTFNRLAQAESNLFEFERRQVEGFKRPDEVGPNLNLLDQDDFELVEANRLCSNFCYSYFNIIELMEAKNHALHGEKSDIFMQFKVFDNTFFHSFFEYRFIKQLRNSLHVHDAIAGIWEENGVKTALLQKNKLRQFPKFQKKWFDNDWKELDNSFPILPVLKKAMVHLKELINHNLKLNDQLFIDAATTTLKNFGEFDKRELSIAERKKDGLITFQTIPQKLSRQIVDYLTDIEKNQRH